MTRLKCVGNLACIGGGGGGNEEACPGGEGAVDDGSCGGVEEASVEGEAGDGGGGGCGGEDSPKVMLRAVSSTAPRNFSGVESSLEADRRVAAVPLFLARTADLWLARRAVSAALVLFRASGRAL